MKRPDSKRDISLTISAAVFLSRERMSCPPVGLVPAGVTGVFVSLKIAVYI